MVLVLHKELEYKVEKPRIKNNSELPISEWTILDRSKRSFTVVILWWMNTVYHLLISEEYKEEGELIWGGWRVKTGFRVLDLMCISLCHICLRQRSSLVTVAYFEKQTWKQYNKYVTSKYYTHSRVMFDWQKDCQEQKQHLIPGYHHDKQLSRCKRRQ